MSILTAVVRVAGCVSLRVGVDNLYPGFPVAVVAGKHPRIPLEYSPSLMRKPAGALPPGPWHASEGLSQQYACEAVGNMKTSSVVFTFTGVLYACARLGKGRTHEPETDGISFSMIAFTWAAHPDE